MKTEEYVLQIAESYDHDYIEVRGTSGDYSTSSYMNDVAHYDSLKLAKLAVDALHCRHPKMKVRILRLTLEEVKNEDDECL